MREKCHRRWSIGSGAECRLDSHQWAIKNKSTNSKISINLLPSSRYSTNFYFFLSTTSLVLHELCQRPTGKILRTRESLNSHRERWLANDLIRKLSNYPKRGMLIDDFTTTARPGIPSIIFFLQPSHFTMRHRARVNWCLALLDLDQPAMYGQSAAWGSINIKHLEALSTIIRPKTGSPTAKRLSRSHLGEMKWEMEIIAEPGRGL